MDSRAALETRRPSVAVLGWLATIAAAEQGENDHDRWGLARAAREGKLCQKMGYSRLPQALDLALARPIVTAELIVQELGAARAGQNLLAELGQRELTGRRDYRAWWILWAGRPKKRPSAATPSARSREETPQEGDEAGRGAPQATSLCCGAWLLKWHASTLAC